LIENNNRRISILHEMAQRIYREWFVSFRYPQNNARSLTGSGSSSGAAGWEVSTTERLIAAGSLEIGDGYRAKNNEFVIEGLPFVRIRDLNEDLDFTGVDCLPLEALSRFG